MSEYTLKWLPDNRMYRELRKIAKTWPFLDENGKEDLGLVLFEAWSAGQRLRPFPSVCVLSRNDEPVGVLCGSLRPNRRNLYIQHIVIAKAMDNDSALYDEMEQELVEGANDFSPNQ